MIEGISVAITTYNQLNYLKQCIYSIKKYSVLPKTDISIFVDGSTDRTIEWLETKDIPWKGRKQNKGAYSGWNRAIKNCQNEYFIQGEDDIFFGPEWDLKLARWIEELGENYVVTPQLVEPILGSYPPPYDCGKSIETFDEQKFVAYVRQHLNRHEAIKNLSFWTMKKKLFFSIGGLDEYYDPRFFADIDFMVRLSRAHPNLRWTSVWDSMIYHWPPCLQNKQRGSLSPEKCQQKDKRNLEYFRKKIGLSLAEAAKTIPLGVQ